MKIYWCQRNCGNNSRYWRNDFRSWRCLKYMHLKENFSNPKNPSMVVYGRILEHCTWSAFINSLPERYWSGAHKHPLQPPECICSGKSRLSSNVHEQISPCGRRKRAKIKRFTSEHDDQKINKGNVQGVKRIISKGSTQPARVCLNWSLIIGLYIAQNRTLAQNTWLNLKQICFMWMRNQEVYIMAKVTDGAIKSRMQSTESASYPWGKRKKKGFLPSNTLQGIFIFISHWGLPCYLHTNDISLWFIAVYVRWDKSALSYLMWR